MQAPVSVDVRAALREFAKEGLTAVEATKLLNCTVNQASAALSLSFKQGMATRTGSHHGGYRYFPTDLLKDYIRQRTSTLGSPHPRKPKLKLVKQHLKPRIYPLPDGTYTYEKVKIGTDKERQSVNQRAAMFVRKLNKQKGIK